MPHTVRIDDKTYDKLKAYCDLNNTSPHVIAKDAIEKYLNTEMYGDAPFLNREIENRQNYQETPTKIDKIPQKDETLLEKLVNSGTTVLESIEHGEDGNFEIHMKKLDGPDSIETKFTLHNDGTVEINKNNQETQQRSRKRRL